MYILQRLATVAWFVWISAAIKALIWMSVYLDRHGQRVSVSAEYLSQNPGIMHWEKISKRWMIISIWIVVAALSYLVFVP